MREKIEILFIPIQLLILSLFNIYFSFFKSKKKYIFTIGVDEVANNTLFLKNTFKEKAISVNLSPNKFYLNNKYDYSLNINNKYLQYFVKLFYGPYLLAKLSNKSDVFIYFWWTGFCVDREMDYKFLRKKNKKIVCIFVGSDVRSHKLRIEYHNKNSLDTGSNYMVDSIDVEKSENRVKKVALDADNYADLIFSHAKDQISYLKSKQIMMPYIYNANMLNCNKSKFLKMKLIKIVHASSRPVAKGTPLVRAAIKKLQLQGYKFEYTEFFNTPNFIVKKKISESHILLNQFYSFAPGLLTVEGMGLCTAVLTSAEYDEFPVEAKNAWLQTRYWEVYDNLKFLLDNPLKIQEYAEKGYEFVKNNYTEEKVKEFYINTFYEHKIINDKSIF